ncbi:MAG TPA: transcriptional regulator [Candidatus Omnitrophica bacterium]|nr:transcriptional regulator [Candidatus Omnitrophota bacterium]
MSDYMEKSEILKALGHPVRLKIVDSLLSKNECNCNVKKMVLTLGLPQSTVSQHLGVLKSRGIVSIRKEGVRTCYRVLDKRVKGIISALQK